MYDPSDERFKAVLENPAYHIDPSNPKFDHRKVGAVFQEVVQKNKKKNLLWFLIRLDYNQSFHDMFKFLSFPILQ